MSRIQTLYPISSVTNPSSAGFFAAFFNPTLFVGGPPGATPSHQFSNISPEDIRVMMST